MRAAPESGRANEALERLIAKWVGVPASRVRLIKGGKSRSKALLIEGDPDTLSKQIGNLIAAMEG